MGIDGIDHEAHPLATDLLTADAVEFLADLQRRFGDRRVALLEARAERRSRLGNGERLSYLAETESVRRCDWSVSAPPKDLEDRRVEITGSPDRELMTAASNAGAKVFMADFEDACSPTWPDILAGHHDIRAIQDHTFDNGDGASRDVLDEDRSTLVVGTRGWHLPEANFRVDGEPISASLFDFGLCIFHTGRASLDAGTGPYFSIPKLESHLEARLWADVISHAEDVLGLDRGSVRVTVLIETIFAAFEMEEILYELRGHAAGLNAGRSDYLFSLAKAFHHDVDFVLPDRCDIRMEVPFMRAYGELLVATCHRRGAHAIGGVTAAIPDDDDPEVNSLALKRVKADKRREAGDGFDGTLVAHPGLVPFARAEFDRVLGERPNQLEVQRDDVYITAGDLLAVRSTAGSITEAGVRANIRIGLRYLAAWLTGTGSVAIDDVMVDLAAAEFGRAQLWQWIHHGVELSNGQTLTPDLTRRLIDDEMETLRAEIGTGAWSTGRHDEARELFEQLTLTDEFADYLTLCAYERL